MMTAMAILIFGSAFGLALYAIVSTVTPHLSQIADALHGRPQHRFEPLATLVRAERRIAVRRWAAAPARSSSWREAA